MTRAKLATTILLALSLVPATPGVRAADTGGGCGGIWKSPGASCHFVFRGIPVADVFADSRVPSGTATVHLRVTVQGSSQTLFECKDSGPLYAFCEGGLVSPGEEVHQRYLPLLLQCHVSGNGAAQYENTYRCKSAKES